MNLTETYFLKALDNYPYNIEDAIENLNYALSYDDEFAPALCLLGKVYTNEIKNYQLAESFFRKALAADFLYVETHMNYLELLVRLNKTEEAKRLLERSLEVPGCDEQALLILKSFIAEKEGRPEESLEIIKKAEKLAFESDETERIETIRKRLKKKIRKKTENKSSYYWLSTRTM